MALSEAQSVLKRASLDKNHKMRIFSFSTSEPGSGESSARMVVLRKIIDDSTIRFYTDSRSTKISTLRQNPNCSLLFWDPGKNFQIRLKANALIHHQNGIAQDEWKNVQGDSRKSYTTTLPPGEEINRPEDGHNWDLSSGLQHFTVIDCVPFELRLLQLRKEGHLALRFTRCDTSESWSGGWIVP